MAQKTYYFKKLIAITDTNEHLVDLPRLRDITIQNIGNSDCKIEFDNAIDAGSTSLTVSASGSTFQWGFGPDTISYKASGNTTLLLTGTRHAKENAS